MNQPQEPIRRPKTSIFEQTLSGVPEADPKPGLLDRFFHRNQPETPVDLAPPPESAVTARLPMRPKSSIFDLTQPGVSYPEPDQPPALEHTLAEALAEAPKPDEEERFEVTNPGVIPVVDLPKPAPVSAAPNPVSLSAPSVAADEDDIYDQGTAAEWNPKWESRPGLMAPLPKAPSVIPMPSQDAPSAPAWTKPALIGAIVLAAVAAGGWWISSRSAEVPPKPVAKPVPPALQEYTARAEAGDVAAMRLLGLRYAYGIGVPPDREAGLGWLKKAVLAGSKPAQQELTALGGTLDPEPASKR